MDYKTELLNTLAKECERLARENIKLKTMLASVGVNCASCTYCGWCNFTYTEKQNIDTHVCTKYKKKVRKVGRNIDKAENA